MERINVYRRYSEDDYYQESQAAYSMGREFRPALEGWFDYDAAVKFAEETDWDGSNHISVNTGSQWDHETLLRTAGGRWVLRTHSNRQGVMDGYQFVSDEIAKDWLLRNHADDIVEHYFGEVEQERGPGRPAIGEPVHVRLGDLVNQVDAYASENGLDSRAEAIRVLLGVALTADRPYTVTRRDAATGLREQYGPGHATLGAAVNAYRYLVAGDYEAQQERGMPSCQPRVEHDGRPVDIEAFAG